MELRGYLGANLRRVSGERGGGILDGGDGSCADESALVCGADAGCHGCGAVRVLVLFPICQAFGGCALGLVSLDI